MSTTVTRRQPQPDGSASDAALVARIACRDVDALGVLYDRFGTRVHSVVHLVCSGAPVVPDVVRDVFLDVQRWAGTFDPARRSVACWVLTLAHHRAVMAVRHGQARPADETAPVHATLDPLTVVDRRALELAYYGAHTQREVAAILGLPLDTVRARTACAVAEVHRAEAGPT